MKTYLVGGAVRDQLLGLPVGEKDWVVIGATPEEMVAAGYQPVGKDFPVFLHPETHEEYALARTERKQGVGYHGFVFHTGPEVTLEEDLIRRDLTINAMAKLDDGEIVDPYGGQQDLEDRVLRHVSEAFTEDPLRVLRVARFYARLQPLGFRVADETLDLLQQLVASGELENLQPERVWQETSRALMGNEPSHYFSLLKDCNALNVLFPELHAQFGKPQPKKYHPEIDSGLHSLLALDQSARLDGTLAMRYAVLCHDYGKGITPAHILPSHRGHEAAGLPLVKACSERMKVPRDCLALALLVTEHHLKIHQAFDLRASTIVDLLMRCDALRRPDRFAQLLKACEADARGRTGLEDEPYPQPDYLIACLEAMQGIDAAGIAAACRDKHKIPDALRKARIKAVKAVKKSDYKN